AVITSPTLLRSFFDLNDQTENSVVVAAPGVATGSISTTAKADLWGAEANVWKNICYDTPGTSVSLDAMVGARYLDLDGSLNISRFTAFVANPNGMFGIGSSFAGNRILERESFTTHNQFYGAQIGARARWYLDYIILSGQFQLALGTTHEDVSVGGGQ